MCASGFDVIPSVNANYEIISINLDGNTIYINFCVRIIVNSYRSISLKNSSTISVVVENCSDNFESIIHKDPGIRKPNSSEDQRKNLISRGLNQPKLTAQFNIKNKTVVFSSGRIGGLPILRMQYRERCCLALPVFPFL